MNLIESERIRNKMTRAEKLLVYCFVSFSDVLLCLFSFILLPIDYLLHSVNIIVLVVHFLFYIVYNNNHIILFIHVSCTFVTILIHSLYIWTLGWISWFMITIFHILCLSVMLRLSAPFIISFYIFTELMIHNIYIVSYFLLATDPLFTKQYICHT